MLQAGGWPLATPLGPDMMAPSPLARDGIWPTGDGAAGLEIVERIPLVSEPNDSNRRYLETKRAKMGHFLVLDEQDVPDAA